MIYLITVKRSAVKEIEMLPVKVASKIVDAIRALAVNPRPTGCIKLKGDGGYFWRIRIGDYRVIYSIKDEIKIINVQKVGHRKDIYK
ncbi:MAG: type II toxin-antitoxin system RelE/ParE family toxin [Bacteroidetes bacterium]|nr:type II toxin-antitoxin system RelE/ParE family toxin [Bacteroidota bacterium]